MVPCVFRCIWLTFSVLFKQKVCGHLDSWKFWSGVFPLILFIIRQCELHHTDSPTARSSSVVHLYINHSSNEPSVVTFTHYDPQSHPLVILAQREELWVGFILTLVLILMKTFRVKPAVPGCFKALFCVRRSGEMACPLPATTTQVSCSPTATNQTLHRDSPR